MTDRLVGAAPVVASSWPTPGAAPRPATPADPLCCGRHHPLSGNRSARDDSGSETVEFVLIVPALMALLVAGLQIAMWALASHAISLAVAEGGAEARAQSGTDQSAAAIVKRDISSLAGSLIGSVSVQVRALPLNFVAVSATGDVPSIFPGVHLQVSAVSAGPLQGFRASG